jgi:hypothetical protein
MIGKVISLATRFIGPKVVTGALITLAVGCATLAHLWQSALSDKANAEIQAETYMTALANTENELERERIQRRALSNAIEERMAREKAARARARAAEAKLAELEANNEKVSDWSRTPVPGDVIDWLRNQP